MENRLYSTTMESPVGALRLAATDRGVCLVAFANYAEKSDLERLAGRMRASHTSGLNDHLVRAVRELEGYFGGTLRSFEVALDMRGTAFQLRVWEGLRSIPFGERWSYGELARHIGRPTASRAVGQANGGNRIAIVIPCHRVINSAGALHGFGGGVDRKRFLLEHESRVQCHAVAV